MKLIITAIFLLFGASCISQHSEFEKSNNGLIYSDTTVKQLKFIVDSLNLKFLVCDLNKTYLSKFQTKAHYVYLESGNVKEAKKDIESNMPFDDFIKEYGNAKIEKDLLVVKFKYKNYEDKDMVEFSSVELSDKYQHELNFENNPSLYDKPLKGKWLFNYYSKSDYSKESISAFYFIEEFSAKPLPVIYEKMIQYSDCMVDTTTKIFFENAHKSGVRYNDKEPSKIKEFMDYVHKSTNRPEYEGEFNENDYKIYLSKYRTWDSLSTSRLDSLKRADPQFDKLFAEAVKYALDNGGGNDEFEAYVAKYYSKKTALLMKRNRRVIGGCSMDDSPRIHALNIAMLAAETVNWQIFLRSHLDIMNDRFERVSDGSYAWGRRKTYIKELEVLDINVMDLLLGICLRIENPSENHYYGSIGRIGRALSETNNSIEIESKMLQMISDNKLDDYNRILIYYLFVNYNYNLDDKAKQTKNKDKLGVAIKTLPEYLASRITIQND
jgi:hypothetical protein